MKHISIKIMSAILSLTIIACAFSSCGSKDDGEITRSADAIAGPVTTTSEDTTAVDESTSGETTTAADTTATTKSTLGVTSVTTPQFTTQAAGSGDSSSAAAGAMGSILGMIANADPDTIAAAVNNFGFGYDADQGIFYSLMDSWQRDANYFSHYDKLAAFGNMRYRTTQVDFNYDGLDWRIQLWKGQYGAFGGAEVGVYTKTENNNKVYNCADDDHLLNMYYDVYLTPEDYSAGNRYFYRDAWYDGGHWWLTGFKQGAVVPSSMVMSTKIRMKSRKMANAFEDGLLADGFKKGNASSQYDTYYRNDTEFYILWYNVGSLNY